MPQLEEALIRARQDAREADPEYRRAQNTELPESLRLLRLRNVDLVALRNHANRVVERALDESTWHVDEELNACLENRSMWPITMVFGMLIGTVVASTMMWCCTSGFRARTVPMK